MRASSCGRPPVRTRLSPSVTMPRMALTGMFDAAGAQVRISDHAVVFANGDPGLDLFVAQPDLLVKDQGLLGLDNSGT